MNSKIIRYFGGKGGALTDLILPYFPIRGIYIEPFGGSATLLLAQRSPIEIYNDIYENVHALFRVLASPIMFPEFKKMCDLCFYSEQLRNVAKASLKEDIGLIERAFAYFYVNRTSHNGVGGFSTNCAVRRGVSKSVSDLLSSIDGLTEYHQRLSQVIIRNTDALELMQSFDSDNVFMYLDPPYHWSTRTGARYEVDMDNAQHESFIDICLRSKCKLLISGYDCALYDKLVDAGWNKVNFEIKTISGNHERKMKMETIWYNYPTPQTLLF